MASEFKIGDVTYRANMLPARQSLEMARRVLNVAGGALGELGKLDDNPANAVMQAVSAFALSADERAEKLIFDLAKSCEVHWRGIWEPVNPDVPEYVPHAGALIELAYQAVMVNLPAFTQAPVIQKMIEAKRKVEKANPATQE